MKTKATQAPEFTPATNPLSFDSVEDTIQAVNAALSLLQNYALCHAEQDAHVFDSSGMYHIIQCCKSALDAHAVQKGGAA